MIYTKEEINFVLYVSDYIYLFFIIVYIICIIIYLLMLYVGIG